MAAVYAIGFPSGKLYIGITSQTAAQRLSEHFNDMRTGSKYAVHNALRKYGRNVRLIVLAQGVSFGEAKDLEIWWISRLGTMRPGGYNLTKGGDGMLGHNVTAETRAKISEAGMGNQNAKGHKHTAEWKAKTSAAGKGNQYAKGFRHTTETKAKMTKAKMGHTVTAETKAKMSEAAKGNQRAKGCKRTEATKQKMSEAQKRRRRKEV